MTGAWPWVPLALLGAYHGLNPGMGWLFALARGLQEKSRAAVAWSLLPIAVGHAVAITLAILALRLMQTVLPIHTLKIAVATALFAMGAYGLFRARHPRGGGMRVGWWGLAFWSFLMASSHGAGLMLIPVLMSHPGHSGAHDMGMPLEISTVGVLPLVLAIFIHTASLLVVGALIAITFYETYDRFGLSLLQRTWFNFDLVWAIALFVAGIAALLI